MQYVLVSSDVGVLLVLQFAVVLKKWFSPFSVISQLRLYPRKSCSISTFATKPPVNVFIAAVFSSPTLAQQESSVLNTRSQEILCVSLFLIMYKLPRGVYYIQTNEPRIQQSDWSLITGHGRISVVTWLHLFGLLFCVGYLQGIRTSVHSHYIINLMYQEWRV